MLVCFVSPTFPIGRDHNANHEESAAVQGVADAVGHDMPVEVIGLSTSLYLAGSVMGTDFFPRFTDVASQSDLANWNMGTFAKY